MTQIEREAREYAARVEAAEKREREAQRTAVPSMTRLSIHIFAAVCAANLFTLLVLAVVAGR